jgi:hypothetical protein
MTNITTRTREITVDEFLSFPKAFEQLGSKRADTRRYDDYVSEGFGTVLLGRWSDGTIQRYNGNGRVTEFLRRGSITRDTLIPVQVVKIKDAIHSRKVWAASNTTMKVTNGQMHNANYASQDPETIKSVDLAYFYGLSAGPAKDADHITIDSMVRIYQTGDYSKYIYAVICSVKKANQGHIIKVFIDEFPHYSLDDMDEVVDILQDNLEISNLGTGAAARKDTELKVRGLLSKFNRK